MDQILIKILLIVSFVVLAAILVIPRRGARPLAIRRLTLLLALVAAVVSVIFPQWLSEVARIVGVGRGTDLLLYGLAVVFAGHAIASRIRHAATEQRVVELARELALMQAAPPPEASR